jgi:hypothetical protein
LCGYESYYRTIGAVVYGSICCVGMNHITELVVQWSMGYLSCGYESYYRTIGAVVYGSIFCVGMNHITERLVQWSMGVFVVWV